MTSHACRVESNNSDLGLSEQQQALHRATSSPAALNLPHFIQKELNRRQKNETQCDKKTTLNFRLSSCCVSVCSNNLFKALVVLYRLNAFIPELLIRGLNPRSGYRCWSVGHLVPVKKSSHTPLSFSIKDNWKCFKTTGRSSSDTNRRK